MSKALSYDEISALDEVLCEHCMWTDYGLDMKAKDISGASYGCEGGFCKEAYESYLEDFEEDDE